MDSTGPMRTRSWLPAFIAVAVYMLIDAPEALAWGPATHVQLGTDILQRLLMLPASVAAIAARYGLDYLYGSVAADMVFARRWSKIKQFCHHWTTGFSLFDLAGDDRGRAFAFGYLSHLAADTVAHGKFIPRQLAVTRVTMNFGHVYWEMRADNLIGRSAWSQLDELARCDWGRHHELMARLLTRTVLPYEVNLRLFSQINRLITRRHWRRSVEAWDRYSRWPLSPSLVEQYRAESLDRIVSVLSEGYRSAVVREDPSGTSALTDVRLNRRHVRRHRRYGLPLDHLVLEAAASYAPAQPSGHAA
jgi:hypothetical protein